MSPFVWIGAVAALVLLIYLLAALLPALFLMRYIYRKDRVEKEPKAMLLSFHYGQ